MLSQAAEKGALATAHVEHATVVVKAVAGQDFVHHKGLRRRHQVGVAGIFVGLCQASTGGCLSTWFKCVGPVLRHSAGLPRALQHGHRVLHVLVQHGVVLDHGAYAGVAGHGRTQRPQAIAALAAQVEQTQGQGRLQQPLQTGRWQAGQLRQLFQAARLFGNGFQDA